MKNFTQKITLLLACLCMLTVQNCATIFNSGSQTVIAGSSEEAENVSIEVKTPSGAYRSKLPATIVTSPSSFNDTSITVKDKCYEEVQLTVGKSVTPSFWANFLWGFGFPIGMGLDFLTGSMWRMDNQTILPLDKKSNCKK